MRTALFESPGQNRSFQHANKRTAFTSMVVLLKAGTAYWLVIHPGITGTNGGTLQQGALCTAVTAAVSNVENSKQVSLETEEARQAA